MKGVLTICDQEKEYARSLMEYLNRKQSFPFRASAFSSREKLDEYLIKGHTDVLLINESMLRESDVQNKDFHTVIIYETDSERSKGYDRVYKYQSAEKTAGKILSCYDAEKIAVYSCETKEKMLAAVYSPVSDLRKNIAALAAALVLSRERKVLYLDQQAFSAGVLLFGGEKGLSEIIYYLRRNPAALPEKICRITQPFHGIDCIAPAASLADIQSVSCHEWKQLYLRIMKGCDYDCIVLDLGNEVNGVLELLEECDRVFVPKTYEPWNAHAYTSFEKAAQNRQFNAGQLDAGFISSLLEQPFSNETIPWGSICEKIAGQIGSMDIEKEQ